jgi:hypothetical protein
MKTSFLRACIVALSMAACAIASAAAPPIGVEHQLSMAHAQATGAEAQSQALGQVAIVAVKAESPAIAFAAVAERMCPAIGDALTIPAYAQPFGLIAESQGTARHPSSAGARHLV